MRAVCIVAALCGFVLAASAEDLGACQGMRASPRTQMAIGSSHDGLILSSQRGQFILGVAASGAYFSQELGVILEDPTGLACRVGLPAADLRWVALDGRGVWRAVEAGICDAADGSCSPVRIEFSPARQTQPRP